MFYSGKSSLKGCILQLAKENEAKEFDSIKELVNSKQYQQLCEGRSKLLKKETKRLQLDITALSGLLSFNCKLFATLHENICDENAMKLLFRIFYERQVFKNYLKETLFVNRIEPKILHMKRLLRSFSQIASKSYQWCIEEDEQFSLSE